MRTISTISGLRRALATHREQGHRIGFVPTMGALHAGHLSLISLSKAQTDITVVSIFVNPTQFGPGEDFDRYPRPLVADQRLLVEAGVPFLFLPQASEIYPDGNATTVMVHGISEMFEGALRPGHFAGVATVVANLFHIVKPDFAYFGQKDAQQVAVLRRMVRDLHFDLKLVVGPIDREPDGLARSSRNRYLSESDRIEALSLHAALVRTEKALHAGLEPAEARLAGAAEFREAAPNGTLDYLDIVDPETFQPVTSLKQIAELGGSATIIIAAKIGSTRLIDNIIIRLS